MNQSFDPSMQGCVLAEHNGPWRLTFAFGRLENPTFSSKSYAGHLRFYSFSALGSLLRAQPCFHGFSTFEKDLLGKNSGKSALK